ncbi:MAG: bifunctional diaminohydroxyphosphoribosylaminopyrimidine deaminase/5-amino-6-(5-phosphoribosylamino)uracil reductase RibD [Kofleriaceae bacterium]|nr:bifunctional diaminohydroxyphosphoribosylaminopyrimidine deaminase/5-amino-6-(5-phosphoribosylamino)uracil reductase RibD [Kofleriaceae bacterium]
MSDELSVERSIDEEWMSRCLDLASKAEGRTAPNPMVGAVILNKAGKLVGEGYHKRAGTAHAEKIALAMAGVKARGGTLYTNLEPCNHLANRRTSPCTPLLLDAGIKRLVVGQADPIRAHAGGAAWLAKRGVEVTRRVLESSCKELNRAFNTWAKMGRPLFVLKVAASLDGRIATNTGESQWITGKAARADGHRLRSKLDGILVGVETVLADDPRLTARGRGSRDPMRIVLDSQLRTPVHSKLLPANCKSKARVLIVGTESAPEDRANALEICGAEVLRLPAVKKRPCLKALGEHLAERGITSVLVEGGASVHSSFLAADLCDELRLYLAPIVIGGQGKTWLGGEGITSLADATRLRWTGDPIRLGQDTLLLARRR